MTAWDEVKHPRNPKGEFARKPGGARQRLQQALGTVKQLTSSGKVDYNPNLRTHLSGVASVADTISKIPEGLRSQFKDRIDRISVESEISVPGLRTPLGSTVAGYYEPGSRVLHVSADEDVGHVVMHEMLHALDSNLEGGHRFSSRRDWMAIARGVWASDYAKTHARSYFVASGSADMSRAGTEMFAELLACYFEGKPLSLTYSGKTPLPPDLDRRVRDFFGGVFGAYGIPPAASRAATGSGQLPLCIGIKRRDGTVEFVSVDGRGDKQMNATRALAHEPLGKPGGPGLWGMKGAQLPAFMQHIRNDIMQERGMPEEQATAIAVAQCKKLAAKGNREAIAALAEWERLRAKAKATRSAPMSDGYDEDGLDASWDGDLEDLPDLTGLDVSDFEAVGGPADPAASRAAKPGSGARFRALKAKLAARGARDPGALAAHIGRKRYGKGKFQQMAKAARKRKGGGSASRSMPGEWLRPAVPLEDIRIVSRAEGDGSGTLVEAYATVFDEPAEIRDEQGHYTEVIDRAAFDRELARMRASRGGFPAHVKVLYNHGKTAEGMPAPEFQLPLGVPEDIRPETRGLLTRTRYDAEDPFTERVLSKIRAGAITAQSFVGGIIRSDPDLRGPGVKYRGRNGVLPVVRRMVLGLREYGPVLWPAYSGAAILGVRMQLPGSPDDGEPDYPEGEESVPDTEGDGAGGTPEEVHPSRYHLHRLWQMRTEEMCARAGITLPGE